MLGHKPSESRLSHTSPKTSGLDRHLVQGRPAPHPSLSHRYVKALDTLHRSESLPFPFPWFTILVRHSSRAGSFPTRRPFRSPESGPRPPDVPTPGVHTGRVLYGEGRRGLYGDEPGPKRDFGVSETFWIPVKGNRGSPSDTVVV